jgi:hypothetical protein
MKTALILLSIAAVTVVGAEAPIPTAAYVAMTYTKALTRVTDKPKTVGLEFATMCDFRPADRKYGPHAHAAVHHYRNDSAKAPNDKFAPGSVLVKEKLIGREGTKELSLELVTGMIKQPAGTSPTTGDWQFFVVRAGKVETAKMEGCAGCHTGAKRDYVFTDLPKR